jgi:multidrug efflux system outer membrane protein
MTILFPWSRSSRFRGDRIDKIYNIAKLVFFFTNRYSVEITIPDLKQNIRETENAISILLGKTSDTVFRSTLEQQTVVSNMATSVPA